MSLDVHLIEDGAEVFSANITHNLGRMANKCGIYGALWRPDENQMLKAKDIMEDLQDGLALLKSNEAFFRKFDAPNGWGLYEHFVPWVERYLKACWEHRDADISVSR